MKKVEWEAREDLGEGCEEKLEWSKNTLQSSQGINKHI